MIDYAAAGDLLEAYGAAWRTFDGDAWVALFTEDAEYHGDPFGPPLVGHNALRAFLLDSAERQRDVEFTVERHWVSGDDGARRLACDMGRSKRRSANAFGRLHRRRDRSGRPDQPIPRVVDARPRFAG